MHCTQCGAQGSGRFCGPCGASLLDLPCTACGETLPPGTRFCVHCGTPLRTPEAGPPQPSGSGAGGPGALVLPWAVSGVLLVALLVVAGMTVFSGGPSGTAQQPPTGALGPAPNVDLASMTPDEAAARLFNRVAAGLEARDTVEVENFLTMAIDAHELARPLDDGQLFRLSFLYRVAGEASTALAAAREGLERTPDHLLLLSSAAEAALDMEDRELAASYYQHLLDVWDAEDANPRQDYLEHPRLLPVIRQEAERFLAGGVE
jgi:hypothetical protein